MKMLLLWLSGVCFSVGLSFDIKRERYGNTHSIRIDGWASSIEFTSKVTSERTVLWRRDDPKPSEDSRRKMTDNYYQIYNVTQRDSGSYIVRERNGILSSEILEVVAKMKNFVLIPDEQLHFTSDLEPSSCNIYFIPEGNHEIEIVRQGRLLQGLFPSVCPGFELVKPCGISNEAVQMSCKGQFEVRDHNGDTALVVTLIMETLGVPSAFLLFVGSVFIILFLSCVIKHCYCGKNSRKVKSSEPEAAAADEEPAVSYQEYDHEPVRWRPTHPTQPTETLHPGVQPSNAPTGPLIHNPPSPIPPPADFRVSASAEMVHPPTVPPDSDNEPRFEVKGMDAHSLLSSDSPHCNVYTSNKLNFL